MERPALKEFYQRTRDGKKIVVVDLGFLGDTIHLIPALWEIKSNYPAAELHVLTSPLGCEVLKMVSCVDRAWAFPLGPPSPSWWRHWDVLQALRREKFDVAFNFSGADRSVFVMKILGARHAVIYRGARKHFWQQWLFRNWLARTELPSPVYEGRRHLISLCGLELGTARFDLNIPQGDREWAKENIPEGAIHLSLSASFALKEWPMANNLALLRYLLAEDLNTKIVVSAAPNQREQSRLETLRSEISHPRLLLINHQLKIPGLAAMLERCVLHVGPDSGMIHLAWALNVPTVAIFRRYADMAGFVPLGSSHVYFDAICPCMESKNPPCAGVGEAECLKGISAQVVGKEICRRLALPGPCRK